MKPGICASIVDTDLEAVKAVENMVDLYEVRIDLIGEGWQDVAKRLKKPWIACNRSGEEGGKASPDTLEALIQAADLGANIIDVEYNTKRLNELVTRIKKRSRYLVSSHNLTVTPPMAELKKIVKSQIKAGADICKIVTTARNFEDNLTVLELITLFPKTKIVSFAMGKLGVISRVLCPLVGGQFTYASLGVGKESAKGQLTVGDLSTLYRMLGK